MECTSCQEVMNVNGVPVADGQVSYHRCHRCALICLDGDAADILLQKRPSGTPGRVLCPQCREAFLDSIELTAGVCSKAAACPACRGLVIDCPGSLLKHGLDVETSPLGQFLTGVGLLLRGEQQQKKEHKLPSSFRIENARPTDLKCPSCEQALTLFRVFDQTAETGADFEICERCYGIWLDRDDLTENHVPDDAQLMVDYESIQPARRICPKCRDITLFAMTFQEPAIEIDCCPACFGTWLDGGELAEFCQHLQGDDYGVINKLIDNAVFQKPALCKTLRHYSQTLFQLDEQVSEQARNLDQARAIQARLLFGGNEVTHLPQWTFSPWTIAGFWQPATSVGGDYFDLIPVRMGERPHLWLCIADVSGKGLPASLLMANFQALLRSFAPTSTSPASLCKDLNQILYHNTAGNKYLTAFVGLLDMATGLFRYTNAGHNPPLLLGDSESVWLKTGGTVLGLLPDWDYTEEERVLGVRDLLLLYTDGITEVENQQGEDLGEEKLLSWLGRYSKESLGEIMKHLVRDLQVFCQGKYGDDATMLLVRNTQDNEDEPT